MQSTQLSKLAAALRSAPRACVQMEESLLNDIIDRLLDVRNGRPGKQVQLTEAEIKQLCMTAKEIFMGQPNLLELEAPIKICGQCRRKPQDLLRSQGRGRGGVVMW